MLYLILNNIYILFIFSIHFNSGVYAKNSESAKGDVNNDSEPIKNITVDSRILPENFNKNGIKQLKNLFDKITRFTPETNYTDNNFGSQLSLAQNMGVILQMLQKIENQNCVRDMQQILDGLVQSEKWALQMFDSFPKFPLGLLYGNQYQLGNFDECTNVKYSTDNNTEILGQYCLADIIFKLKRNISGLSNSNELINQNSRSKFNASLIHWAMCLPSSCNPIDGTRLIEEIFTSLINNFESLNVVIPDNRCYIQKSQDASTGDILYGSVVAVILLFIVFATMVHIFHMKKRQTCLTYNVETIRTQSQISTTKAVLMSFSVIQTVQKLLKTKPNELNLECLSGIKFLSMSFIVIGHSLIFIFGGPIANTNFLVKEFLEVQNGLFLNSPLMVDTFLLVSGFLMCRLLLLELDKRKGMINVFALYITRYIRLTPAYLVVLGFYITWLPKLGDGPLWKEIVDTENNRCLNSWWTNLLYINNYVKTDSLCMFQAWYLAVDYHLFIIAPFIVYPLWKWNKMGRILLFSSTLFVAVLPAYFTLKDNLDPTLLAFPPEIQDLSTNSYFANAYIKTHMRASSYFLGLIFGYVVHSIQSNGTKIPNLVIWMGWILATLLGVSGLFSIVAFFEPTYTHNDVVSAIYAPFHRVAWCLAIGWVIVMCVTDNAATVNTFLKWSFFVPLSRLTYCAYLINGLVNIYHKGTIREATFLSKFQLSCTLLGHLVLTFFFAFWLCICFESPIHGLEKIFLRKKDLNSKSAPSVGTLRVVEENRNT